MDSHPTSRIRFRDRAGVPIPKPREWTRALIEFDVPPDDFRQARANINGQRVDVYRRVIEEEDLVVADWELSGTGRYRIRLECAGLRDERSVTVHPTKISTEAYAALLDDLQSRLPASIAIALQRGGAFEGIEFRAPSDTTLAEQVHRIRRAVMGDTNRPGLLAVLEQLAAGPHRVMQRHSLWVRRNEVRRPEPSDIVRSLWRAGNLDTEGNLARVLDSRVEFTFDVYENRMVKVFAVQVERRLRELRNYLAETRHEDLFLECSTMLKRLVRARRTASFLDDVQIPPYVPQRLTMVLLKVPPYRAAYQGFVEFNKSTAVVLEESALQSPLENLPYLYELRGILLVIEQALQAAVDLGYKVVRHRLLHKKPGGFFVDPLKGGRAAVVLKHPDTGVVVRVVPQKSYGSAGPLRSVSFVQRPDVSVLVQRLGEGPDVYLFDPKYKLDSEGMSPDSAADGKPKKVDIDKMHAYRDAIRDEQGNRVVRYAAILYPGPTQGFTSGLEAVSDVPGEQDAAAALRAHFREWFVS